MLKPKAFHPSPLVSLLMRQAKDPVALFSNDGTLLFANDAFARFHSGGELPKLPHRKGPLSNLQITALDGTLLPRDEWPVVRASRGETVENVTYRISRLDSEDFFVARISAIPVTDDDQELVLLTLHDLPHQPRITPIPSNPQTGEAKKPVSTDVFTWQWNVASERIVAHSILPSLFDIAFEPSGGSLEEYHWIIPPEELPAARDALHFVTQGHGAFQKDLRIDADGQEHWISAQGFVQTNEAGEPVSVHGVAIDVTRQRAAELALRRSEAEFRAMIETNPVGIVISHTHTGKVLEANDAYLKTIQYTRAELEAGEVDWMKLTPPEWLAVDTENIEIAEKNGQTGFYEKEYVLRDGTRVPVLVGFRFLDEQHDRAVAFLVDLTEAKETERALSDAQSWVMRLVEANLVGIVVAEIPSVKWANDEFLRLVGKSREQLLAGEVDWVALTPPEYAERDRIGIEQLQQLGKCEPFEKEFLRDDGSRVPVIIGASVLTSDPLTWICFVVDQTPQKEVERVLRDSEERFRKFFELAAVGAAEAEAVSFKLLRANAKLSEITKYPLDELVGMRLQDIVLPADAPILDSTLSELLSDGAREVVCSLRLQTKQTFGHWVTLSLSLVRDGAGEPLSIVFLANDIAEQKKAQEALATSEELYRSTADMIPQILTMSAANGSLLWANAEWERFFGRPLGKMPELINYIFPADRESTVAEWRQGIQEVRPFELQCRLLRHDGQFRWFRGNVQPVQDAQGNLEHWVGSYSEIHQDKEMEQELSERVSERTAELERALAEMEQFTYSMAHDLHSPLRAIRANSTLLLNELGSELSADHREMLNRQNFNANKLAALIDDLLRYARVGKMRIHKVGIDLGQIAEDEALDVSQEYPDRRIDFMIARDLHAVGDPNLLGAFLKILFDNAVKYSPNGGLVVVGHEDDAYFVRDQGIGFDMRYAQKIFRPFERLHRDAEFRGTGIGLALAQRMIEKHGGRIWAEAVDGKGATFKFTLGGESPASLD